MEYIEVNFKVVPYSEKISEILVALLSGTSFESFENTDTGIKAYISADLYIENDLIEILSNKAFENIQVKFTATKIPDQNWNKVWESGFKSIVINDNCIIRAPFHSSNKKYKYDIIIEPKMSFGTGHHETTSLMIEEILKLNMSGKSTLDIGSGTGVLAILSSLKGAKSVTAIDIDEWAFLNSVENIKKNNISNIEVLKGNISDLGSNKYNIILANINRNILLRDIGIYSELLLAGGTLLLSGFYLNDMKLIMLEGMKNNIRFDSVKEKNNWAAAKFIKY